MLHTVDDSAFVDLKSRLVGYRRMRGYYIVDLVSIERLRQEQVSQEELLDAVFEYFDDQPWPPKSERPSEGLWSDHEVASSVAKSVTVQALVGGPEVGHTDVTMPPDIAMKLWAEFESLFDSSRQYYVGMGFGDRDYVFLHGTAIVDHKRAGVLWIVESD